MQPYSVQKKQVYLHLPYKGDVHILIRRRLKQAVDRAYPMANLRIIYSTERLMLPMLPDKIPTHAKSCCVYQFKCTCGCKYIGRTERNLLTRIKEHIPKSLRLAGGKLPKSSIARHLIDSGHHVDPSTSFKVINCQRNGLLLRFAESAAIRKWKPSLCTQKEMVVNLSLPW